MKTILIVGGNPSINWYKVFENAKIHGEEIQVEMAHWDGMPKLISVSYLFYNSIPN